MRAYAGLRTGDLHVMLHDCLSLYYIKLDIKRNQNIKMSEQIEVGFLATSTIKRYTSITLLS